jgi:hypothetical protein
VLGNGKEKGRTTTTGSVRPGARRKTRAGPTHHYMARKNNKQNEGNWPAVVKAGRDKENRLIICGLGICYDDHYVFRRWRFVWLKNH